MISTFQTPQHITVRVFFQRWRFNRHKVGWSLCKTYVDFEHHWLYICPVSVIYELRGNVTCSNVLVAIAPYRRRSLTSWRGALGSGGPIPTVYSHPSTYVWEHIRVVCVCCRYSFGLVCNCGWQVDIVPRRGCIHRPRRNTVFVLHA